MSSMALKLREKMIRFLLSKNIAVSPATNAESLHKFIRTLKPYNSDKALIRFGPDTDGGYLIPDDIEGIEACFSPGVSKVSGFELECANRGMKVFLADASVDKLPEEHPDFIFEKKFIGAVGTGDFITIDDWVKNSITSENTDLILQMDIEGFEYETILSMRESLLQRFRIIVIEFHAIHLLWSKTYFDLVSRSFEKLLQHHTIVHIHPNNLGTVVNRNGVELPEMLEISFLRNDRIAQKQPADKFPHKLDFRNCSKPDLPLPESWYLNS
jgi:hypothetical protein